MSCAFFLWGGRVSNWGQGKKIFLVFGTHKKFFQLSGEDGTQLAYLANGGDGVISVTANIAPKLVSSMHDEWFKGNYKEAMSINEKLSNINKSFDTFKRINVLKKMWITKIENTAHLNSVKL